MCFFKRIMRPFSEQPSGEEPVLSIRSRADVGAMHYLIGVSENYSAINLVNPSQAG